jgi:hypothetical protein
MKAAAVIYISRYNDSITVAVDDWCLLLVIIGHTALSSTVSDTHTTLLLTVMNAISVTPCTDSTCNDPCVCGMNFYPNFVLYS